MKNLMLTLLCVVAFFTGCNMESKKALDYNGDGKLVYLKAPLFGISGWRLELPRFGLTNDIEVKYNLAGLPEGEKYKVYLIVPSSYVLDVKRGTFGFKLMQGKNIVRELPPTPISQMTNTSTGPDDNNFWFYDIKNPGSVYAYDFDVTKDSPPFNLIISYHGESLRGPVAAYVKIERGGYK